MKKCALALTILAATALSTVDARACWMPGCEAEEEGMRHFLRVLERAREEAIAHPRTKDQQCFDTLPELRGNCVQEMNDRIARNNAARALMPNQPKEIPIR
jgi:hypothetical protein